VNPPPSGGTYIVDLNDGIVVTGTTALTQTLSVLIPANTFAVGGAFRFVVRMRKTTGAGINSFMRVHLNTINSVTGSVVISRSNIFSAANVFQQHAREIFIKSAINTQTIVSTATFFSDSNAGALGTSVIDWTVDQWFIVSLQNADVGDSTFGVGIVIKKYT
jgi:hypothetical protein